MNLFRTFATNLGFSLQVLLVFFLVFGNRVAFPLWMQSVGRMHPLLLHLPIGFLILAVMLLFFRSEFKKKAFYKIQALILLMAAVTSSLTALMGVVLSAEGGYDPDILQSHQTSGVILSFLVWAVWLWHSYLSDRKPGFYILIGASLVVLVIAGHLGANLTHGENFISQPLRGDSDEMTPVTDSTALFTMAIEPILKKKCYSCHNQQKAKGKLIMTSPERLMAGGEHGPIWVAGKPDSSEILIRLNLPEEDEDHMPPTGKIQLTENEIEVIERWIASGADLYTPWTNYDAGDSLRILSTAIRPKQLATESKYTFSFASPETIEKLNTPYCTVQPIATDEPALKADFYIGSQFKAEQLQALREVKGQLVHLNLAGMPLTDELASIVTEFTNLEKLNLNNTRITGKTLIGIGALKQLRSLSLDGTQVDFASLRTLALPNLHEVFIWNTPLKPQEIAQLKTDSKINWLEGFKPTDKLKLTPPILINENFLLADGEEITLKHNLPGTTIQYTTNNKEPDSIQARTYEGPLSISEYTIVKARAVKEGWFTSNTVTFHFFKKGIKPDSAALLSTPGKSYRGLGAASLIDSKKGDSDNFRDTGWMGFQDNPAITLFYFKTATALQHVTLSYHKNIGSHLMPPASVELWAGESPTQLRLLAKLNKAIPAEYEPNRVEGIVLESDGKPHRYYKLVANPVAKLPAWHNGKGKKGWVFIDEVIFL